MKKFPIIIAFLLCLLAMAACHKDKEMDIKEAIVSNEEISVSATQARLSWQVDFVGQFHTGVELSQNENMSDLRRIEATKEEDGFVAVVDSLSVGKKYYYRIVVWNKFGSYEQPLGDFTTSKTFSVHVSAEPSLGGTVAGGGTFAEGDTCTVVATANEGYNFVNWTENGTQASADSIYQFAVTNNRNLVAHFTSQEYTITAIAEPSEGGTVDGSGGYNNGDECTLTATANEGYEFVDWTKEDGTQVSTNTTYRFMVTESATYIAHFQVKSYTITVSADPAEGGSVEGAGTYEYGQSCTVRATEATGYHFVNWTENGGQVSANEVYTFTVTGDRDLVANFSSEDYIIQVRIDPEEGGTVEGAGGYNYNDECTLKATANAGYDFVNWTKEDGTQVSTETTYRFIVEESATYVAHFQAKVYTITVSAEPIEGGTVSGGGDYHYGDECTLTATANEGYEFVNWTENGVVSAQASYPFTVTGDRTLVANFARETYTISVSAGSGGSAYVGDTPGTLQGTFTYGQPCTVHAVASSGYEFANWTDEGGIVVSSQADYSFDVYGSQNLTANFRQLQYTITVSAGSGGSAYVGDTPGTLQGTFTYNQSCTVHARANNNYIFSGWKENGAVVSSQVDYTFQVTGNRTLVANFTYNPPTPTYNITVSANPSNGGTVSGGGTYNQGQTCTLTATNNSGFTFDHWTRNGTTISGGATISFTVTSNATYVAHFISNTGGHAYVDLGLPSGLLWATCNVGADTPEDYGYYFAWGETQPKSDYSWSTYQYGDGSTFTKYTGSDGLTTLLPEDDAATANWGSGWRMPTQAEWQELLNYTTHIWTTQNGVTGRLFTATNGNSLFLPAAGYRNGTSLNNAGTGGYYWSSSLNTGYPSNAWSLRFYSGNCYMDNGYYRIYGFAVRPVRSSRQN
jgi:uncharacterized protein (TIGR02145 family)